MAKREAKAVTEADTEALDWWYDLEEDFDLLCFKAWNAVIYQVSFVCTATMPLMDAILASTVLQPFFAACVS